MNNKPLLYLFNATFLTMDDSLPESHHMLVQGNIILHCSPDTAPFGLNWKQNDFIQKRSLLADEIDFVDLHGATVLPGFCDAHAHFLCYADTLSVADLTKATTEEEAVELLYDHAQRITAKPGEWIRGHGWIHNYWKNRTTPTRHSLDKAFPNNPVFATSKCLHLAWTNTTGIRTCGLHKDSKIPMGSALPYDQDGELTGLLVEEAGEMVMQMLPKQTQSQRLAALMQAQKKAHSYGLTAFHCPETDEDFQIYQRAVIEDKLRVRIVFHPYFGLLDDYIKSGIRHGFGNDWLRIGGIKAMMDGSLGGRTAYMYDCYKNEPENSGMTVVDFDVARKVVLKANANGFPAVIHAIGDKAVGNILRIFKEAQELYPAMRGRNSIEHLQLLSEKDIPLLKEVCPIASVQPVHLCADIKPAEMFWGDRSHLAYAFKTVKEAGCLLTFGSDVPVESFNPFISIHGAVNRQSVDFKPEDGWYPEQKISVLDALKAFTIGPAKAAGTSVETRRGTLNRGKLADFVVLKENPLNIPPEKLSSITPLSTWVGGECVFKA